MAVLNDMPQRSGYEEVEEHKINVVLNDIGKAFLLLEDYYANGAELIESEVPDVEYDFDAEEYYRSLHEDEERERAERKTSI
ncbi:hypothetical protein [Bradyrhizobium sp. SYSU BS000235]|uniref:hypothetical protein n=1 Tax=Bradyrhizobium sp. SYSU BS000235 TaxID=3411332 RepID=UPI003C764A29